jgi:hypothetical protein
MANERPTIGIIGGTGDLGSGLARRWSVAGYTVGLGSRSKDKAEAAAGKLGASVRGANNVGAARAGDIVVIAVPYPNHAASLPLQSSLMSKTYLKSDHFNGGGSPPVAYGDVFFIRSSHFDCSLSFVALASFAQIVEHCAISINLSTLAPTAPRTAPQTAPGRLPTPNPPNAPIAVAATVLAAAPSSFSFTHFLHSSADWVGKLTSVRRNAPAMGFARLRTSITASTLHGFTTQTGRV